MYKYQLYAILTLLSSINSHVTNNSISQWSSLLASFIFAVLTVLNWGKKE
jgi:hypothetical protein